MRQAYFLTLRVEMETVNALAAVLSNTYLLLIKTQGAHWNVVGGSFVQLHDLFGDQYGEMWGAVDGIAEMLRTQDPAAAFPPGDVNQMLELSVIQPAGPAPAPAAALVQGLLKDHEALCQILRHATEVAKAENREEVVNLMGERIAAHGKHKWMLQALLTQA